MISAIINGHYDVAAFLVDHGANPNLADKTGRTALYAAVDFHTMPQDNRPSPKDIDNKVSSFELIQLLIAKGANVNAQLKTQQPYRAKLDRGDDTMLTTGTTPMVRPPRPPTFQWSSCCSKRSGPEAGNPNGVNPLMAAAGVDQGEDNTRKKTEPEMIETTLCWPQAWTSMQ
jgi:ankyrin repeat protein